jgi:metal-responsive CopG/Arc/MetJ family transcriptional regulator
MQSSCVAIGISLPKEILARIDSERGDVSRSRYLLRAIENTLRWKGKEEWKKNSSEDSLDSRLGSLQSSESRST